jgi:hypothetical protein
MYLVFGMARASLVDAVFDRELVADAHTEVEVVASPRLRRRLTSAVWSANPESARWPRQISLDLLILGVRLGNDGERQQAIDFLGVVADSRYTQMDVRLAAMDRRAMVARDANMDDYAEMGYHVLRDAAHGAGDLHMELKGDLGLATIAIARGEFDEAETLLETTRLMAKRDGDCDIAARASACMGTVAGLRGDHRAAYMWTMAALPGLHSATSINRARQNAAESLAKMGRLEEARELATWIATRADDAAVRVEAEDTLDTVRRATHPVPTAPFEPISGEDAEKLAAPAQAVIG